jgi:uncharacterized protein (DUF608 family)
LKNETSRRDFVKAAVAASLAGVAAPANATDATPSPVDPAHTSALAPHPANPSANIKFPRVHTGRQLARISCPLGGIGTGGIGLGGRGNLQDWQIFNRPDIGNALEYAFPSLWVKTGGPASYAVVLERRLLPPYDLQQEGLGSANVPGLPRLAEAKFLGSFPLSRIAFEDPECPVSASLEAFSPFQPLDADASGLPTAILTYEIRNPGRAAAEVAVAWSISNPVGSSGKRINDPRKAPGIDGLFMSDPSLAPDDPMQGSFVLAALPTDGATVEVLPAWRGGSGWRVGPEHFWFDTFAATGHLGSTQEPSTPVGSVSIRHTIPAGGVRTFRFLLAWHFPNRTPERCGWSAPKGMEKSLIGNYYCTRFKDAWAVAEHVTANLPALEQRTREFVAALTHSTLPPAVKDAASANLSTLVSNTSFRIADGSFHGFEGCGDKGGLGFGTCSHVWNYEVATQFLFPSLARSMRETNFGYATDDEGHMDFRHKLPLGFEHWGAAAADGQMGQIVKLYFDWIMLGDNEWLRHQWPGAKRALAYAWRPGGWDERKSGVMDGVQHNTNDIEFYGPNSMCSGWYLAALRAMARMADAMGDPDLTRDCNRMCDQGSRWIDANLFNGEFYIQKIRGIPKEKIASGLIEGMGAKDTMHPEFQLGDGCFADQLIGQHMATVSGLGDLLDPAHIRKTLESIYRCNYRRSLVRHASVQRVYALNGEAAVINCDYSKGTRPEVPMPYYSENWTGLEHSLAALMISHGMVAEGVEFINNLRLRYDGEKANPYDETEYGRHYARAMASWAAIPMLSGFHYNARTGRLELAPRLTPANFRCFWSTPGAWGSFELSPGSLQFSVIAGSVSLNELLIAPFPAAAKLRVTRGEAAITYRASAQLNGVLLQFASSATIDPKHALQVRSESPML